jgi:hypothetical protein
MYDGKDELVEHEYIEEVDLDHFKRPPTCIDVGVPQSNKMSCT